MSDQSNYREASSASNNQDVHVRIWPAILIALAHLAAAYAFARLGTTNIQNAIALGGVPLISTILLLIWWLVASRTPLLDRLIGLVLFIAAAAAVIFSQKSTGLGGMLMALALPYMTIGMVVVLVATYPLRWPLRRWVLAAFLLTCAGVYCAMRVDSIGGNLAPVTSWRWQPTTQEQSEAVPRFEAHATAVLPAEAGPGDWPAFRGPRRDGRATGIRFSTDWSTPPKEVWRRNIGPAWSSFIAVGDYLFTQEQRGSEELVTCYNAATGDPVWQNQVEAQFDDSMGLGPRATPTFVDGKLYTQGGTGVLQCLDAATGNTLWKRDLTKDAERGVPGYGFCSSPLVANDLVIVFTLGGDGKSIIAYRRETGEPAWRAGHHTSGYCSPQLAVIQEVPQVLMVSDFGIQSFVPETGAALWEYPWGIKTNPRCTQPVEIGNKSVMFGATGTSGSCLLRIEKKDSGWTTQEKWMTKKFRPYFNDGVLHKGYYYGFDGERVACLDLDTGERRWEGNRYSGQLLLLADMDMLLILSEAGDVALVPATPERFSEVARFKALTGKTWNHPVVAHGKLFVRNSQEAACFELN